jgi:hypothetical protein
MATDPNVVIVDIKSKINSHLDTIEQGIMGDLIDVEEKVKLQIENLLSELSKRSIDTIFMICGYTNWTANCVMLWTINRVFHFMVFAGMNNL